MNKVIQKQFYKEGISRGDCLPACIESITGIKMPIFPKLSIYITILKNHGWIMECDESLKYLEFRENKGNEFFISIGDGGRGSKHAVIIDYEGNLLHDPYPDGNGNLTHDEIVVLYKIQ